ncbi:hypothetical protein QZN06_00600 [Burkholderia multivorans]|uniref:hypothetical protein n=1 Tax=Burkholderia anthina TaxID=179879 RepID=UPI00158AE784|nr:hypothetical protein [Burkholderia anthina]MDN8007067.1 hypothetical protein [Burkholderia multivorans]
MNHDKETIRTAAARLANRDDADLWRWFCMMYEEGRLRWCAAGHGWLVSIDHRHLATEPDFDTAMRAAHRRFRSGCRGITRKRDALAGTSGSRSRSQTADLSLAGR